MTKYKRFYHVSISKLMKWRDSPRGKVADTPVISEELQEASNPLDFLAI